MEARRSHSKQRLLVWMGVCLLVLLGAFSIPAERAEAANYRMVLCAANNGSNDIARATNTTHPGNPAGLFNLQNSCGPAPFPAGCCNFLQINETGTGCCANDTAYGSISWTVPPFIAILAGGGYTRMPEQFNDGWRGRFWGEGFDGSTNNFLMQGNNLEQGQGGIYWYPCSTFCSHLWPFSSYGFYRRFVFEMTCFKVNPGCDKNGTNTVQANTLIWILADVSPVDLHLTNTGSGLQSGQWVRGTQVSTYSWSDQGTGIRMEWVEFDPDAIPRGPRPFVIDHSCNRDFNGGVGEFARNFQPCSTASNIGRSYTFNSASFTDGEHVLRACGQDYAQWQGLDGTGGASCDSRIVRFDNTAPAEPGGLQVLSANPARYLDRFGAKFTLPANAGSPITKIHYNVINATGEVVVPEQTVSGTNLTELKEVVAPKAPGDYKLRVWLEDQVGWVGPASTTAIPRDTVPPAAPQNISVTAPSTARAADGFDVRWQNILDAGSPIDAVHYEVLKGTNQVVAPQAVAASNIESIPALATPKDDGQYTLRMWLSDAEGNIGAPASVPLAYQCPRADNSAGEALSSGLGQSGADNEVVQEGTGSTLKGNLRAAGGGPAGVAPVCVFSRIITDPQRDFLGLAMTGGDGSYRFPVTPGASRELITIHRRDHRELVSRSTIQTIVHPTLKVKKKVIRNKQVARFYGEIPGPHNDRVVIVLQAKVGKGWSAFRRYRTRNDGKFVARYRFRRTFRKTKYIMRAQVRQTVGYPYLQGNSKRLTMLVLPGG